MRWCQPSPTTWPHDACYGLALHPDEKLLAVAARDLELWELDSPRYAVRRRVLPGADDAKAWRHVAFSSDGQLLAAGNAQGTSKEEAKKLCVQALEECSDYAGRKGMVGPKPESGRHAVHSPPGRGEPVLFVS